VQRLVFAVALSLAIVLPSLADVRIVASSGGVVGNYLNFFLRYDARASGSSSTVRVTGFA
jgi:hypothetical protein